MTTSSFAALVGPTTPAIAAGRNEHCQPPTFKPAALAMIAPLKLKGGEE